MYQKLTIVGNVGQDAELKYTKTGISVCTFSVAVNKVTGSGDDKRETTTWFRVTAWRERAETAAKYVKKGMKILVVGEVSASAYISSTGTRSPQASLEVTAETMQFLSRPPGSSDGDSVPDGTEGAREELPI